MIIDITRPTFAIDLDNRGSYSYNTKDFTNSKFISVEEYFKGFPELKDGEILFRYTKNRGYILKNEVVEPEVNIEALIEKWSNIGFLYGLDNSVYNQHSYCYEIASNILNSDNHFGVIYPIIHRILRKYDTSKIDYGTCKRFVENLISDYDSFNKEQYPHIEFMLTGIIGNDKIDIEAEIIRLYCEINDFNKILNKK